jgi:hypothetical protein
MQHDAHSHTRTQKVRHSDRAFIRIQKLSRSPLSPSRARRPNDSLIAHRSDAESHLILSLIPNHTTLNRIATSLSLHLPHAIKTRHTEKKAGHAAMSERSSKSQSHNGHTRSHTNNSRSSDSHVHAPGQLARQPLAAPSHKHPGKEQGRPRVTKAQPRQEAGLVLTRHSRIVEESARSSIQALAATKRRVQGTRLSQSK